MRTALLVLAFSGLVACTSHERAGPPAVRHSGGGTTQLTKGSPEWVTDQFYAWSEFPDEEHHITGEFARRFGKTKPLGTALKPSVQVSSPRQLSKTANRAIYATTISDTGRVAEWYTYLVRDGTTWKIDAVRTLEFNSFYYSLLDTLRRGWRFADAPATLRKTMELTVSSDSTLRTYFMKHQSDFDALVRALHARPTLTGVDIASAAAVRARRGRPLPNDVEAAPRKILERVAASTVFRDAKFPGCTFVRIGGMGKSQTGYLYAPAGCTVPPMNPSNFIYVQKIQRNWYAYKSL